MKLNVQKRELTGSSVKKLRREGILPAVIFSKGKESVNIQLDLNQFVKVFNKAGETEIIDIAIEGEKETHPVLVKELQYHHIADMVTHVGFQEIDLTQTVRVTVPVNYLGEEEHSMIKNGKAILITLFNEVEIEALPKDIPQVIELSIDSLKQIEDVLTVADLKKVIDTEKVTLLVEDEDAVIAKLDYAEMLEVEEEEMDVDDIEITGEKEEDDAEESEDEEKPKSKAEPDDSSDE